MSETKTHTAESWGVEYADGNREWRDTHAEALILHERDARMAHRYPEDDVPPVALLKRVVVTSVTITREAK